MGTTAGCRLLHRKLESWQVLLLQMGRRRRRTETDWDS